MEMGASVFTASMNREPYELWQAALKSGAYKQCTEALHAFGECCPLGVLCEVAIQAGVIVAVDGADIITYDGHDNYPPPSVLHWAGLETQDPLLGDYTVTEWNDMYTTTLPQIAELVRLHVRPVDTHQRGE
jgi:hypothetical protein